MTIFEKLQLRIRNNKNLLFWAKILRRQKEPSFRSYIITYLNTEKKGNNNCVEKSFLDVIKNNVFNEDFRQYVILYRTSIFSSSIRKRNIVINELGDKNPHKIIMLLNNKAGHGGFCGLWIYYLNRLAFSDRMGFYSVFNCTQSDFYQEKYPVHGTKNVYEYFFQQPCGISLKSAWKSQMVVFDENTDDYGFNDAFHVGGAGNDYIFKDEDIRKFAALQRKYIHFQPCVERKLERDINRLGEFSNAIGVHARGTDYKVNYKGHPVPVSSEDYIIEVEKVKSELKIEKVFLATDDEEVLNAFKMHFGDSLLYYEDVVRSSGTVWNCYMASEEKNSHYRLGYEIVRDVFTLSKCRAFVCSVSYVGFMTRVLNIANQNEFEKVSILQRGLREEGLDLTKKSDRDFVKKSWDQQIKQRR